MTDSTQPDNGTGQVNEPGPEVETPTAGTTPAAKPTGSGDAHPRESDSGTADSGTAEGGAAPAATPQPAGPGAADPPEVKAAGQTSSPELLVDKALSGDVDESPDRDTAKSAEPGAGGPSPVGTGEAAGSGPAGSGQAESGQAEPGTAEPADAEPAEDVHGDESRRGVEGQDAGPGDDAGQGEDTGLEEDAGPEEDGGQGEDGGLEEDAGTHEDTGRGRAAGQDRVAGEDGVAAEDGVGEDGSGKGGHRLDSLHSIHFWGASPAGLLIGLLLALLGFGLVVQLQSNTGSGLVSRRQDDLVRILDDLSSREERLRQQIAALNETRTRLSAGGDNSAAALAEARRRSNELGILAGTLAAQGPGIQMTVSDPHGKVSAEDMLDAIEELRGAGAEAISVGPVRIGLSSAFTQDTPTSPIVVDGVSLTAPYVFLVIGDPPTLATAMNIPGGVIDTVRGHDGETQIVQQDKVVIRALRQIRTPQYAQPSPTPTN